MNGDEGEVVSGGLAVLSHWHGLDLTSLLKFHVLKVGS